MEGHKPYPSDSWRSSSAVGRGRTPVNAAGLWWHCGVGLGLRATITGGRLQEIGHLLGGRSWPLAKRIALGSVSRPAASRPASKAEPEEQVTPSRGLRPRARSSRAACLMAASYRSPPTGVTSSAGFRLGPLSDPLGARRRTHESFFESLCGPHGGVAHRATPRANCFGLEAAGIYFSGRRAGKGVWNLPKGADWLSRPPVVGPDALRASAGVNQNNKATV
jgi:hypothetical protein